MFLSLKKQANGVLWAGEYLAATGAVAIAGECCFFQLPFPRLRLRLPMI
jgi:hypothetical protein